MKTADKVKGALNPRLDKTKEKLGKIPNYIWFLTVFVVVSVIILAIFFPSFLSQLTNKLFNPFPKTQKENVATPAEPRIVPLATGRQLYNISGGANEGPQMTQAVIDPIDPRPSQIQTYTLKANSLKPIVEIKATVITDNEENVNFLKLISGTDVDGVWQGSWRIKDDYNYDYQIELVAKNNENIESKATMTFR